MRTSLRYRVADMLIHNKDREIAGLVGANPVRWLTAPPPNYLGEIAQPRGDRITPGNWYFDVGKKELIYRVKNTKHFMARPGEQQQLRFRVAALQKRTPVGDGPPIVEGLSLILIEQYVWF